MDLSKIEKILWTIYDLIEAIEKIDDQMPRSWH